MVATVDYTIVPVRVSLEKSVVFSPVLLLHCENYRHMRTELEHACYQHAFEPRDA